MIARALANAGIRNAGECGRLQIKSKLCELTKRKACLKLQQIRNEQMVHQSQKAEHHAAGAAAQVKTKFKQCCHQKSIARAKQIPYTVQTLRMPNLAHVIQVTKLRSSSRKQVASATTTERTHVAQRMWQHREKRAKEITQTSQTYRQACRLKRFATLVEQSISVQIFANSKRNF